MEDNEILREILKEFRTHNKLLQELITVLQNNGDVKSIVNVEKNKNNNSSELQDIINELTQLKKR